MLIPANLSHRDGLFIAEMNFSEKNWVLCFSYNPRNNYTSRHTENGGKVIDSLSKLLIDKSLLWYPQFLKFNQGDYLFKKTG